MGKNGEKVKPEQEEKLPFDPTAWRARLDALGAEDFLPDGLLEELPLEPDASISFD